MDDRVERERKFLVRTAAQFDGYPSTRFMQGYPVVTDKVELRIRSGPAGQVLTVKGAPLESVGPVDQGLERIEEELPLSSTLLAYALMEACDGRVVVKTRYSVAIRAEDDVIDHWVVDEYHGDNEGLKIAEFEYEGEIPRWPLPIPSWIEREVTHLPQYLARNLATHPFSEWSAAVRDE